MTSNLSASVQQALAERNAEHNTVYSMLLNESEVVELAEGRVPEQVRAMAEWLREPLEAMLQRKADARQAADGPAKAPRRPRNGSPDGLNSRVHE